MTESLLQLDDRTITGRDQKENRDKEFQEIQDRILRIKKNLRGEKLIKFGVRLEDVIAVKKFEEGDNPKGYFYKRWGLQCQEDGGKPTILRKKFMA